MANDTQLLKGILEGCILKVISKGDAYGYKILETLNDYGYKELSEGSVYPLLLRLEKKKIIRVERKKSPYGPMRKYYYLTDEGHEYLNEFKENWSEISNITNKILCD